MLPLSRFLKEFGYLNLHLFKYYGFKNKAVNHCSLSFMLNQRKLHNVSSNEDKQFPLNEISNIQLHVNYDQVQMYEIINEITQAKSKGGLLPEYIKLSEINELFQCRSRTQRQKYLKFLFKKEKKKLNDAEKKHKKRLDNKNKDTIELINSNQIQYGIGKNTLLLRTWKRSVIKFYEKRLANSALFGQKIVIDLSYDKYMWSKEKKACAAQLRLLFSRNRYNPDPYDLYFCNADPKSQCVQFLQQEMSNKFRSLLPLFEQSYLDLFPKERLVYLSPHASETLKTYDHNAVYIIGGFVDIVEKVNVSLKKAEEEGIKSYSLPLNDYVLWGCGSRSLSIDQVFSIMQTIRDTGDWKEALQHVPTRKLRRIPTDSEEIHLLSDKLFVLSN